MARVVAWGDELWELRAQRSIPARIRRARARKHWRSGPEDAVKYALSALGKATAHNHVALLDIIDELIAVGSCLSGGLPPTVVRDPRSRAEAHLVEVGGSPSLQDLRRSSH
jgi:hypothetical protein